MRGDFRGRDRPPPVHEGYVQVALPGSDDTERDLGFSDSHRLPFVAVLSPDDLPDPEPGPSEDRVRVILAPVHPPDSSSLPLWKATEHSGEYGH
jgi:hypothetical protein